VSRPHTTWHDGKEPCQGKLGAPCKGSAVDARLLTAITSRARCPPGSAGVSPAFVSAQPSPSPSSRSTGKHARTLLHPSPCRSRQQGRRLPHRRHSQQFATAVHAGGTPALPGGAPLSITLAPRGAHAGLPGHSPADATKPSRFVSLRVTSWITLFQVSTAPALPGRSFEEETVDRI